MISGYDYDYDYDYIYIYIYIYIEFLYIYIYSIYIYIYIYSIYIYIYIYISPPANPRFFLEGAHEPRGRHRVSRPRRTELPPATPPAWEGAHNSRQPPPPTAPPEKGTPARRVGDIVPCRVAMNRHGPTPGDTRPAPPRSRGAPVVPRAGSNPPPPHKERPPSGALAQPLGASRGSPPSPPGPSTPPTHQPQPRGPPGPPCGGPPPPGTRAPEPRCPALPAPPVSIRRGPFWSGLAARGRRGASPRLHQDSPPWMMLGGIRPIRPLFFRSLTGTFDGSPPATRRRGGYSETLARGQPGPARAAPPAAFGTATRSSGSCGGCGSGGQPQRDASLAARAVRRQE